MRNENLSATQIVEPQLSSIPAERVAAAMEASYELETLAIEFPTLTVGKHIDSSDEYLRRLFVNRIKELACVVMSALGDDRETSDLLKIVGLEG